MITAIIPKLPFIDKDLTMDFYVNGLGFTLGSDYGDYFIVFKDSLELHLFVYPDLNPKESDFMIYLRTDTGIDRFYESLKIPIHPNGKLEDKPWGQKEFSVIDPNGTLLTFGQSIEVQ